VDTIPRGERKKKSVHQVLRKKKGAPRRESFTGGKRKKIMLASLRVGGRKRVVLHRPRRKESRRGELSHGLLKATLGRNKIEIGEGRHRDGISQFKRPGPKRRRSVPER